MIKYTNQMKTQKFNIIKKRKGRKKKTIKRCTDILTFDIEVTSAWITDKGKIIGYKPNKDVDYWNDKVKLSLPYIWQFSFNDTVYYGRNIYDFKKVLDDLPDDVEFLIFVHNLGYEWQTALINLFTPDKLFARTPHDPMYATFKEHPNIEFRCSYILTNMSLATWGKQLGIEKLTGDLDYTKLRTPLTKLTKKEMGYCERDCVVVYEGIKNHLKQYKNVWNIPLTSTSKVRRPFKNLVTSDADYMRKIKKLIPADIEEYERWRRVFAGGYTHCNRKYLNKTVDDIIYHVDIASSYPFILAAYKFPYGRWTYEGRTLPDQERFESRAYIVKIRLTGVRCKTWNTYISSSKCIDPHRIISDNGRVLVADELTIYLTEFDYDIVMRTYDFDNIESLGCWHCKKQYLPKIYIDFVLQQYERKSSYKGYPAGSPEADMYGISKAWLNSLYGMAVSNVVQSDVVYDPELGWYIEPLTADRVNYKFEKMRRWFDKSYFLHYAAGCWVTSAARHRLWQCILRTDEHGNMDNDLIYTDTDSLFYLNRHDWSWFNDDATNRLKKMCDAKGIDFERTRPRDKDGKPHPLGVLEYEQSCDRFRSLGAKKYCEERDGKLYMTISGVNKSAVSALNGNIENFKDGFIFDKDHPDVHKSEITYLDDMPTVTYPDGFVSDLKHGINMRPTGYQLSVPTIYGNMEKVLQAYLNPSEQMYIRKRGVIVNATN